MHNLLPNVIVPTGIINIFEVLNGYFEIGLKMRFINLIFSFFFLLSGLSSQTGQPHDLSPSEQSIMPGYIKKLSLYNQRSILTPPPTHVRTMAEWEPIQAVIISWSGQAAILKEIVRNAVKECKVLIITTDTLSVTNQLLNAGIELDSVRFIDTPFNSIWVCDYGPWTVYGNDVDSLWLIDWIYNRPRPQDDATPSAVSDYLNIPMYEATVDPDDFVHTGGNHFSDGLRNAFSSQLVLNENPDKTESEIDSIAKKYLGVSQYIKFPTLPYDGIHHLDMHMRIIDEETIIVGEYPEGVADGPQINANVEYLNEEIKTSFGNSYRIIRIPMPPDANNRYPDHGGNYRTYTNAVFLNKTLLVPTYEEKYDTTALRIYRENLPGYKVVGINCNSIISSLGALHCITKLVGVSDPLLIAHARLRDTEASQSEYPVSAYIRHSSGIMEASLHYRLKGDSLYIKVPMSLTDTMQNIWSAQIPSQVPGVDVQYYIEAKSYSGKEQVRPLVAPSGYFTFRILGEPVNQAPSINILYPEDQAIFSIDQTNLTIEINAQDVDGLVDKVVLFINGDSTIILNTLPFEFEWTFPGEGSFEIQARAADEEGATSWSEPVHITIEGTTGTHNMNNHQVKLFPNPVKDILWINHAEDIENVIITDLFGQTLHLIRVSEGSTSGYDFSHLPAGIYFLKYLKEKTWHSESVIKR
jgi:agmatine/peptidylarginine deiminase